MNRLSLRNNLLKFKTAGKWLIVLEEFYRIYPNLVQKHRRMSTYNRLDLQTLRSQPVIVPKNLPNQWSLGTPSHTRLRACDHYTSSTLVGGKCGGASPSSLHTMPEGPMDYVDARWMLSLRGFLHGIKWIMFHGHLDYFQKPYVGGRPNPKPGDHGTPNAVVFYIVIFLGYLVLRSNLVFKICGKKYKISFFRILNTTPTYNSISYCTLNSLILCTWHQSACNIKEVCSVNMDVY